MAAGVLEQSKTEAFMQKMVETLNGAALALMSSIGHRTGLFDTMAGMEPADSGRIADRAGLSERYVREWLGAMVTGGVVEHDPATGTYHLPPEHAAWLTRTASPNNLAVPMQFMAVLGSVEDQVVDAFTHGKGVPYSAYRHFHRVMAEESAQSVVAGLLEHILPLVPHVSEQLEAGIDVLDVGCGSGLALMEMAAAFPASRFTGYDFSEEAIGNACAQARRRGLDNARFEVRDVAKMNEKDRFDLITAFDAIHDQAQPAEVLGRIRAALRPDGVFLMQDIKASSHVHHNLDQPFATFIYTISCMHCMSVSLACEQGAGLGAAWGKEMALRMLREAGFGQVKVRTLEHDPMNYYYIVRS
jgi:2-polyprenyl-3-methyl-5-hydroxy-6-metoxy-1,4-benzoquinol methylase